MSSKLDWSGQESIASKCTMLETQAMAMVLDIASYHAASGENKMKAGAPWTDRTSVARGGLFGKAEATDTGARILLGGQADYIPYLELGTRFMAPRPIIVRTTNEVFPEVVEDLGLLL